MDKIYIVTIITLLLVLAFGIIVMKSERFKFDLSVRSFFKNNSSNDFKHVMNLITKLANVETIFIIAFPIFFYLVSEKEFVKATSVIISLLLSIGVSQLLKFIFRVNRPTKSKEFNYVGYSFPSGHSSVGMGFYLTLGIILSSGLNNDFLIYATFIMGLLIGLSRLVLGVHWFSDVIAGLTIGILCSYWSLYLYNLGYYFKWMFN